MAASSENLGRPFAILALHEATDETRYFRLCPPRDDRKWRSCRFARPSGSYR